MIRLLCAVLLALVPLLTPCAAQGPQRTARIGVLTLSVAPDSRTFEAFRAGLRELGYVENQSSIIIARFAEGKPDSLAEMARELVAANVDVIVTESVLAAREAKRATESIPIITAVHGDPIGAGLAKSLTRPEGNVTGLSLLAPELSGKRLQLLKELRPTATTVGVLWNPGNPAGKSFLEETRTAARSLGVELHAVEATMPAHLESAFASILKAGSHAIVSLPDGMLLASRQSIVGFASKHRLAAIYPDAEFATAGGLMAYGPSLAANFRQAASYVDRILKGAKPGDLPIEQPTRFELVLNLRAARSMNLAIPGSLIQRADIKLSRPTPLCRSDRRVL